jgi:hypothetical protein
MRTSFIIQDVDWHGARGFQTHMNISGHVHDGRPIKAPVWANFRMGIRELAGYKGVYRYQSSGSVRMRVIHSKQLITSSVARNWRRLWTQLDKSVNTPV